MSESSEGKKVSGEGATRREVIRKAIYVVPCILTIAATPAFARSGSGGGSLPGGGGHNYQDLLQRLREWWRRR